MHVFVAGATGVIGRNLIPMLRSRGHMVRGLSTNQEGAALLQKLGAQAVTGDLLGDAAASDAVAWVDGCDAVVHVATALGKHPEAPTAEALKRTGELRTQGARALLQAARKHGTRKYIQESIELAYPDGGEEWIHEEVPLDASPERAAICAPVIEMEAAVISANAADLRCCILRGGRLVGDGTAQENAIEALRQGTLRVAGDGTHFISPVHVEDYARAIVLALEAADPPLIANINAVPLREGDYYDALADALEAPRPARELHRPAPPSHRCATALARSSLSWEAQQPLISVV